jgi:hypothetical protein
MDLEMDLARKNPSCAWNSCCSHEIQARAQSTLEDCTTVLCCLFPSRSTGRGRPLARRRPSAGREEDVFAKLPACTRQAAVVRALSPPPVGRAVHGAVDPPGRPPPASSGPPTSPRAPTNTPGLPPESPPPHTPPPCPSGIPDPRRGSVTLCRIDPRRRKLALPRIAPPVTAAGGPPRVPPTPWPTYLLPGSVTHSIDTEAGRGEVAMAAASRVGVCLADEPASD